MVTAPVRGFSFIDVVVGSALILIIFLSLTTLLRTSLLVASVAKARAGATGVANTAMEHVRSLPYDSVGTIGGIPAGEIPQYATTTLNAIAYQVRTFVEYVDDSADGSGGSDTNSITTDYKRIKIAVTYLVRGKLYEVVQVSSYTPSSIETTTGGGTLKVQVVNATGVVVPGATVRVVNASTSPTIDVTTFTDATGVVLLGGAATSTEYQVYVSKPGYSSAQTYVRDGTNQNPSPGYLTVVKNVTTTSTFAIDLLADLTVRTYSAIAATSTTHTFTDASKLTVLNSTVVSGATLHLATDINGYVSSGSALSVAVTPAYLSAWTTASTTMTVPNSTDARVHVTDGSSTLLPDAVLPGNSAGFNGSFIDLSGVSTSTYPTLGLSVDFSSSNVAATPTINNWSFNALVGPIPAPNVAFGITGAKTIGSTGAGTALYKTSISTTTDSTGFSEQSVEWDSYDLSLSTYDVVDACSAPPYAPSPGGSVSTSLYLSSATTNMILVAVRDNTGANVSGATVTVSKVGYSNSVDTSSCGTAYFGGLSSGTYTVTIQKTGYTTTSDTNVDISGHTFYDASFP